MLFKYPHLNQVAGTKIFIGRSAYYDMISYVPRKHSMALRTSSGSIHTWPCHVHTYISLKCIYPETVTGCERACMQYE